MGATTIETREATGHRAPARVRLRPARSAYTNVRSTPEYKAWLARLAAHLRKDLTDTVDEALARLARAEGFDLPPMR